MTIHLPISKSIANRLLICKAMRGDDLQEVVASPAFASYPDDVRLLAQHLAALQSLPCPSWDGEHPVNARREQGQGKGTESNLRLIDSGILSPCPSWGKGQGKGAIFHCANAGTVIRFLTAYCARLEGCEVTLTGSDRMKQRPIGPLVSALRSLGADIDYLEREGFPPLCIRGKQLNDAPVSLQQPMSTQFVSALMLVNIKVQTDSQSPYISLTRSVIRDFREGRLSQLDEVERDWSSAAFWLEREALGLAKEPYTFPGLRMDSEQGDKVAVELFARIKDRTLTAWDFSACPDLYPAAAVACHLLGLHPVFTGLESLRLKESDRIAAIESNLRLIENGVLSPCPSWDGEHPVNARREQGQGKRAASFSDHRIAMAFLAAGFEVDDPGCVSKSYPDFLSQLRQEIDNCRAKP